MGDGIPTAVFALSNPSRRSGAIASDATPGAAQTGAGVDAAGGCARLLSSDGVSTRTPDMTRAEFTAAAPSCRSMSIQPALGTRRRARFCYAKAGIAPAASTQPPTDGQREALDQVPALPMTCDLKMGLPGEAPPTLATSLPRGLDALSRNRAWDAKPLISGSRPMLRHSLRLFPPRPAPVPTCLHDRPWAARPVSSDTPICLERNDDAFVLVPAGRRLWLSHGIGEQC